MRLLQNELLFLNKNPFTQSWQPLPNLIDGIAIYDESNNNKYAIVKSENQLGYIYSSADGENWTFQGQNTNLSNFINYQDGIQGYVNGSLTYIVLGTYVSSNTTIRRISRSSDFSTWSAVSQITNLTNMDASSLAYIDNKFCAFGWNPNINGLGVSFSTNGTTWSASQDTGLNSTNYPGDFFSPSYKPTKYNNLLYYISQGGKIFTSPNGLNWTQVSQIPTIENFNWYNIANCGKKYIATGKTKNTSKDFKYSISYDLVNWSVPRKTNQTDVSTERLATEKIIKTDNKIIAYNTSLLSESWEFSYYNI